MNRSGERRSSYRSAVTALALALAFASFGARAHADAPSCGWGDGVVLTGGDTRELMITDDGGSGVIAVVWPINMGVAPFVSSLRFFHVLEQGKLDPSLPATGVLILSGSDLPSRPELYGIRALPDGAGGAYVLFRACISTLPHTRCWEASEVRLLHVNSQGAPVSGWPLTGQLIMDVQPSPVTAVDLVPAGAPGAGVIAAWIAGGGTPQVQAQWFAPDGSTVWPGGLTGTSVLGPATYRYDFRAASDHAGGCVVVVVQQASNTPTRYELRAGRVNAAGVASWGTAGVPVITQPAYSVGSPSLAVDESGRSFITVGLSGNGFPANLFAEQLLNVNGARTWSIFGITLGSIHGTDTESLSIPAGFVSLHTDSTGMPVFQLQDEFGTAQWGDGVAANWTTPPSPQRPLVTPDGHVISVWQSQAAPPDTGIRALELDEAGNPVTGWPASGALVCGALLGSYLADAMIANGNLFVAMSSGEMSGVEPRVQRLSRAVLDAPPARSPSRLEFAPPAPNPARGAWLVRVALPQAGPLIIEAFDIAGRRALEADLGARAPGWHVLDVPGSAAMAPGVYRVRVRSAGLMAERMLVKLR